MTANPTANLVSNHLPCHRCGYDLFSRPIDSLCPECGTPVMDSISFAYDLTHLPHRHFCRIAAFALSIGLILTTAVPFAFDYALRYWSRFFFADDDRLHVFWLVCTSLNAVGMLLIDIAALMLLLLLWRRGRRTVLRTSTLTLLGIHFATLKICFTMRIWEGRDAGLIGRSAGLDFSLSITDLVRALCALPLLAISFYGFRRFAGRVRSVLLARAALTALVPLLVAACFELIGAVVHLLVLLEFVDTFGTFFDYGPDVAKRWLGPIAGGTAAAFAMFLAFWFGRHSKRHVTIPS